MITPRTFWFAVLAADVLGSITGASVGAQASRSLFRQPSVSATDICFTFGGDIWLVPRSGGVAHRLTSAAGEASDCHFSPDGKWVAYTGRRDSNADVYVVPTTGGAARRLTFHPGIDQVRGWTPDGKVLFTSTRMGEF